MDTTISNIEKCEASLKRHIDKAQATNIKGYNPNFSTKLLLYFPVYRERAMQKSKNRKFSLNFDFAMEVYKYNTLKQGSAK